MRLYGEFTKVTPREDGALTVVGICSSEVVDSDGETILASAIAAALDDYRKFPAVREMHRSDTAAGTALDIRVDGDRRTRIEALIVDPVTVKKITAGVLRGFSVGGKVLKRSDADPSVIEALALTEVSVVDRPSNPEAVVTLVKLDAEKVSGGRDTDTAPPSGALDAPPEHPRSGQGVDNRHDSARKPVDPASPTGPGATLTSNRTRKCAACGQVLRLACGCVDADGSEAEKAAREVGRHELAKVQAEAAEAVRKLAAAEAALVKRTGERDSLQAQVAALPKGVVKRLPVAVGKAADMTSDLPEVEDEDEPLGPVVAAIKKLHRGGGRVVS